MLKKIDQAALFLEKNQQVFRCPFCHEAMKAKDKTLFCSNRHRFDLSKKGTLYFLKQHVKTEYDQKMFQHRRALILNGMYDPLIALLAEKCQRERVLDVGCGEGSFLHLLEQQATLLPSVGFDLSKEGVYLASDYNQKHFFCVADLTNLPFNKGTFSTILNIFSPSNYQEFARVSQSNGQVIKVVPRSGYLKELRQAFFPEDLAKQHYSNEAVIAKFQETFPKMERKIVTYTFEIPENCQHSLLEMSPLEWSVTKERKEFLQKNLLSRITIDLEVLIGRFSADNMKNM